MKNALIIHGTCDQEEYFSDKYPSLSNSHWLPWLQKQLLIKGFVAQTPEMPEAYAPDYDKWAHEFAKFSLNEDSILIGHSCGAGFLLRWLSENKTKINKLILVAPWLDPNREKTDSFFEFEIDENLVARVDEIHLLVSLDDEADILESVKLIKSKITDLKYHEFTDFGHFTYSDMKTNEFPELLDFITN